MCEENSRSLYTLFIQQQSNGKQAKKSKQKFRLANFHFKFATIITANAIPNEMKSFVGDEDRLICLLFM